MEAQEAQLLQQGITVAFCGPKKGIRAARESEAAMKVAKEAAAAMGIRVLGPRELLEEQAVDLWVARGEVPEVGFPQNTVLATKEECTAQGMRKLLQDLKRRSRLGLAKRSMIDLAAAWDIGEHKIILHCGIQQAQQALDGATLDLAIRVQMVAEGVQLRTCLWGQECELEETDADTLHVLVDDHSPWFRERLTTVSKSSDNHLALEATEPWALVTLGQMLQLGQQVRTDKTKGQRRQAEPSDKQTEPSKAEKNVGSDSRKGGHSEAQLRQDTVEVSFGAERREQVNVKFVPAHKKKEKLGVVFLALLAARTELVWQDSEQMWTRQHVLGVCGVDKNTTVKDILQLCPEGAWRVLLWQAGTCVVLRDEECVLKAVRKCGFCALWIWEKGEQCELPECWKDHRPISIQDMVEREEDPTHIYTDAEGLKEVRRQVRMAMQQEGAQEPREEQSRVKAEVHWPRGILKKPVWGDREDVTPLRPTTAYRKETGHHSEKQEERKEFGLGEALSTPTLGGRAVGALKLNERAAELEAKAWRGEAESIMEQEGKDMFAKLAECLKLTEVKGAMKTLKEYLRKKLIFNITPGDYTSGHIIIAENGTKIETYVTPLRGSPEYTALPTEVLIYAVTQSIEGKGTGVQLLKAAVEASWARRGRLAWGSYVQECEKLLYVSGADPAKRVLEELVQGDLPNLRFWQIINTRFRTYAGLQESSQGLDRLTSGNLLEKVFGNMNQRTFRILRADGTLAGLLVGVKEGRLTFPEAWEQVLARLKGIEALETVERLQKRQNQQRTEQAAFHVHENKQEDQESSEEDEQGCGCEEHLGSQEDDAFHNIGEGQGMFVMLEDVEDKTVVDAKVLPEAMCCLYFAEGVKAPEQIWNGKRCYSCGVEGHLSFKCPAYNQALPFAPEEVRTKLLARHKRTGALQLVPKGRHFGEHGSTEKARQASGKKVSLQEKKKGNDPSARLFQ